MPDPVSHGQMMNYLVRNSEDKKRMREYFETNQITTASNMNKPREPKIRQVFEDFNFRNPLADGGRIGFAPGKLVIKEPKTDKTSPDFKGQLKDKRKVKTSTLDDAFEVRNIIIKNKGHVASVDELARLLGLTLPGGKPDFKKAQLALDLALDSFDELKGFKLAGDKYKNIDKTKFRYLDMIAKSFANHNLSTDAFEAAAHLLPSNMGKLVDLGDKIYLEDPKDPKKPRQILKGGFFDVGERNITPAGKKFLVDRISTLTGQKFNLNRLNELILKTQKVRRLKGQEAAKLKKYAQMNQEIKNLANDNQIQNLLKGTLNRETQQALLERATKIVGGDVSIASRRLFQMAEAMSDTTDKYKDLGVKINNTKAIKIINTGKEIGGASNRYAMSGLVYEYYGNVVDKALGAGEGRTFIGKYQQAIRRLLDKGQSPDEIFSLTASARQGLSPYAIFTQQLRTDVNSAIKGAFIDSELSKKHEQLQEIFQGRKYSELSSGDKQRANKLVEDFEAIKINALNQPTNPGAVRKGLIEQYGEDSIQYQTYKDTKKIPNNYKGPKPIFLTEAEKKNIQLPEFDLKNPPSKAIAGYENFNPNLKSAFDKSYDTVGYSMKVTPGMLTQKQLIENLKIGKAGAEAGFLDLGVFRDIGKGADKFLFRPLTAIEAPTLAIPQSAYAASKIASDVAKGQETDTSALDITLPTAVSSLAASKKFGLDLFADNAGKVKRFLRGPFTQTGVRALSRGSLFATPFLETAIQGYNARQALLKAREKYGTDDMVPTAAGMAPREYVRDLAIENQKFEGEGLTPFSAAGGGLAKQAGDRSGAMLRSMNPDSQGLSGLLKRGKKI